MAKTEALDRFEVHQAPTVYAQPRCDHTVRVQVLIPVALKWQLPVGMKLGCLRNMNPALSPCGGGDGVVVVDLAPLRRLVSQVTCCIISA